MSQVCFDLFDIKKQDFLSGDDLGDIMRAMGFRPSEEELKDLLDEVDTITIIRIIMIMIMIRTVLPLTRDQVDEDGSGEIEFGEFCQLCVTFLVEDPDMETMQKELKDAFRSPQSSSSCSSSVT